MDRDPTVTNPELYRVIYENERVRVLEYRDHPGDRTLPHTHPDSVMVTLSSFRRRLVSVEGTNEVELQSGITRWVPAQAHWGENIGDSETHVVFVELKESAPTPTRGERAPLGPSSA